MGFSNVWYVGAKEFSPRARLPKSGGSKTTFYHSDKFLFVAGNRVVSL